MDRGAVYTAGCGATPDPVALTKESPREVAEDEWAGGPTHELQSDRSPGRSFRVPVSDLNRDQSQSMKIIKSYPTTVEADLARITLEAAGIPSIVVGISAGMEGGVAGGGLLGPGETAEAGATLLKDA